MNEDTFLCYILHFLFRLSSSSSPENKKAILEGIIYKDKFERAGREVALYGVRSSKVSYEDFVVILVVVLFDGVELGIAPVVVDQGGSWSCTCLQYIQEDVFTPITVVLPTYIWS